MGTFDNLRVLVADDDRDTCEYVAGLLQKMRIQADWVDDGYQAVSKVEEAHIQGQDFDVCFVDWKMPGIDGLMLPGSNRKQQRRVRYA